MLVEHLMTRDVKTCGPQDTLSMVAQIFWNHDCGCVPVVDQNSRVVGMVTDRDICLAAYWQGRSLRELQVCNVTHNRVCSCKPRDTIATAEKLMKARKVRRLPVIDDDGRLVGLLSIKDIVQEAARERTSRQREISDTEVVATVAAICERVAVSKERFSRKQRPRPVFASSRADPTSQQERPPHRPYSMRRPHWDITTRNHENLP